MLDPQLYKIVLSSFQLCSTSSGLSVRPFNLEASSLENSEHLDWDENLLTSNLFGIAFPCGRLWRLNTKLSLLTMSPWSIPHSAPHMDFVARTSCLSRCLTIMQSMRCQFFERGCIHESLFLRGRLKFVFVIDRLCSAHFCSNKRRFELHFPTP